MQRAENVASWWHQWLSPGLLRALLVRPALHRLTLPPGDSLFPLEKHLPITISVLGRALTIAFVFLVSTELFPDDMKVGRKLWSVLLVWLVSFHFGVAFEKAGLPKALGMLVGGTLLQNLPGAGGCVYLAINAPVPPATMPVYDPNCAAPPPVEGLNADASRLIRAGAMALVLARSGLSLDVKTIVGYGKNFFLFASVPSLVEALVGASILSSLFSFPFLLSLSASFMISAVGPAIIVAGCSSVKDRGYRPEAPNFLITCCCFDDATCIIGFNIFLHAFVRTGGNAAWQYALGPLNLVFGIFFGLLLGGLVSLTSVWNRGIKRTIILAFSCFSLIYVADSQGVLGAGAIGNIVMGLSTRFFWQRGWPKRFLSEEHRSNVELQAQAMISESLGLLSTAWYLCFYPLLFGLIGASLNFKAVDPLIAGRAITYAVIAVTLRAIVATCVAANFKQFTKRERIFMGLSWVSKATTQAAFATVPLDEMTKWCTTEGYDPAAPTNILYRGRYSCKSMLDWGNAIQWCCVMSIFVGTPLGTIFMTNGAQFLLKMLPEGERVKRQPPAPPATEAAGAEGGEQTWLLAAEGLLAEEALLEGADAPPPPPPPLPPPGASIWDLAQDATGRRYFFSRGESAQTAWHLPDRSVATARARRAAEALKIV